MSDVMINLEECPTNWLRVELGSFCDIIGGFAAPKGEEPFKDGTVPFVKMQDLGRYHRTTNLVDTRDKLNLNYVKKHRLRIVGKGSILIPRSGSVSLNHRAILGVDACIVSHICALVLKSLNVDNRYLYYALCNFNMQKIMRKTTGLDAITFEEVKHIQIPLPTLEVQRNIADILQKVDSLQEKRKRTSQLTSRIIQSVFLKTFGDPIKNLEGMPTFELEELCTKVTDGTHDTPKYVSPEIGVPLIMAKNVREDGLDLNDVHYISRQDHEAIIKRSYPQVGDILYTNIGANRGIAAEVNTDFEFSIKNVALFKPNPKRILPKYLISLLNYPTFKSYVLSQSRGGAQNFLHLDLLRKLKVPVPALELQQGFNTAVEIVEKIRHRQQMSTIEINELFRSLVHKTFRGELITEPKNLSTRELSPPKL